MNRHDEVHAFGQLRVADQTPQIAPGGRILLDADAPAAAPPSERPARPDHDKDREHEQEGDHEDRPHPRRPPSPRPHGAPALTLSAVRRMAVNPPSSCRTW